MANVLIFIRHANLNGGFGIDQMLADENRINTVRYSLIRSFLILEARTSPADLSKINYNEPPFSADRSSG